MKQHTQPNTIQTPGKCGDRLPADQPQGRFRVRAGDLVQVEDRHVPRQFVAEVRGFFRLHKTVYVQLGPLVGQDAVARQSTKVRNIVKAWRLTGRPRNPGTTGAQT